MPQGALSLDALRERIRELEGVHVQGCRVASGLPVIDGLVGGLPMPGIIEVTGPAGSGRARLALSLVASWLRRQQRVAWIDPERRLYPPAAAAHGVDLARLLLVRPTADRDVWAVEQVLRSGCFPLVVVADPPRVGRAGQRWAHAAEAGHCAVVVLREQSSRDVPATVRLGLGQGEVVVLRDRGGVAGRRASLPPWPEGADPWT